MGAPPASGARPDLVRHGRHAGRIVIRAGTGTARHGRQIPAAFDGLHHCCAGDGSRSATRLIASGRSDAAVPNAFCPVISGRGVHGRWHLVLVLHYPATGSICTATFLSRGQSCNAFRPIFGVARDVSLSGGQGM